ncbi:5642_t:CDS:1 [Acaulospora colombiana]|uniref:5642_t:CDS:1 n=1 Tax=Acaulospora colombiana TaxID=27376 RepID=A0ACA9M485_9GLOM|nr:5642_t:CDS:1 [Acaulospora colombiana]
MSLTFCRTITQNFLSPIPTLLKSSPPHKFIPSPQIRHYTARKPKKPTKLSAPIWDERKLDDGSLFISRVPLVPRKITMDQLPPPLRPVSELKKRQHTEEQKEEMRRLRWQDPRKYTCAVLSKMFDCPSLMVARFAPLPPVRMEILKASKEIAYSKMGWKKRIVKMERARRRALW